MAMRLTTMRSRNQEIAGSIPAVVITFYLASANPRIFFFYLLLVLAVRTKTTRSRSR